jgi:putative glycosyl hydrolase-like family 15 (GHL15) protein
LGSYHGRHTSGSRHLAAGLRPGMHTQGISGRRRVRPSRRPPKRLLLVLGCTAALVGLVGLLVPIPRATGSSTTVQFSASADAFVSQARPNRNFGSNLVLRSDASPTLEHIYLRFDVGQLSGIVTRATLRLYANSHDRVGFAVRSATTDWTEDRITYANAPVPGALAGRSGPAAPGSWTSVDVTSLVPGEGMTSFVLTARSASAGRYASRERGMVAPQLVIETTAAATPRATTTSVSTTTRAATTTTARPTTRPVPTTGSSPQPAATQPRYNRLVGFFPGKGEHLRLCDGSTPGDKYAYIVVQWYTTRDATCGMTQWRRRYPHAKILAYQNFGAMIAGPHHDNRPSTLVTQENAATHESWWLHNSAGKRITFSDYSYLAAANMGDPGWQAQARTHITRIKADGYDGIMLDDVNLYPGHGFRATEANHSVEYRTDPAYGAATKAAMAVLGPYIKTHGLLAFANVGMDPWIKDQYSRFRSMLASLDGVCREFWMAWSGGGGGPFTGQAWSSTLRVQVDTEAAGRAFLANSYPLSPQDDTRSVRYGQASFLIGWDGEETSGFGYVSGLRAYKQYGRVIGVPTGPRQAVGVGWMRRYTAGIAVVNPHPSASQTFSLGRTYKDENGASRSTVNLGPASGMILHT